MEHKVDEGISWWECSCGAKGRFLTALQYLNFSGKCPEAEEGDRVVPSR